MQPREHLPSGMDGSAGLAVQVWQAQLVNTGDNVSVLATWSPGFALQALPSNYC